MPKAKKKNGNGDALEGRRTTASLVATAKAINSGTSMGGASAALDEGVGGLVKQFNTAANELGRNSRDGIALINAATKLRSQNPREFRGRGAGKRAGER